MDKPIDKGIVEGLIIFYDEKMAIAALFFAKWDMEIETDLFRLW